MNLGPQMADISMDNQMADFNTRPYGDWPLKIKILKIGFVHAREDPKKAQGQDFMNLGL